MKLLKTRRFAVKVRGKLPILSLTVLFAAGQVLGLLPVMVAAVALGGLLVGMLLLSNIRRALLCILVVLIGITTGVAVQSAGGGGIVSDLPRLASVDGRPRRYQPGGVVVPLTLLEADQTGLVFRSRGKRVLCRSADLPWRNASLLRAGDVVALRATFRSFEHAPVFSRQAVLMRQGYGAECRIRQVTRPILHREVRNDEARDRFVESLRRLLGNGERAGLFLAMSLGLRDTISVETETAFKRTGLAHLLVLSGYQVTLLFGFVYIALNFVLRRTPFLYLFFNLNLISSLIAFSGSVIFVYYTSIELSSLRAVIAACIVTLSRHFERGKGFFHAVCVSFLMMCVFWPACFLEPGVQLTFAALCGIGLAADGTGPKLTKYLKMCVCASLFTSVVVFVWFGGISIIGFILNPIIAPLISLVSCNLGFMALLAHLLGFYLLSDGLILLIADILEFIRDIVLALARLEVGYIEPDGAAWQITLLVLFLMSFWVLAQHIRMALRHERREKEQLFEAL